MKEQIICSELTRLQWLQLASIIDNGFIGTEKHFLAERRNGYYYLETNKCDEVSLIRVYCKIGVSGIDKITRLGSDTEGWKEVHPETYKSMANYLRTLEQQ